MPFTSITDPNQNATDNIPRAYLNVIFFNERFEFVSEGSTALRVSQSGDNAAPLVLSNIKAPKNGYAYIYLSNENDDAVYFDNFTVSDTRGRIIEENHYYAFGLKIAGISSVKLDAGIEGSLKNNYQYQGDYSEMDDDIGWNDFALRNYDAQIGRWVQQDQFHQFTSPYIGMGNDPINLIDPSGGWAATGLFEGMSRAGIVATTTLGGAIVGMGVDILSGGSGGKGLLIGAALGAGSNFGADLSIALDIFRTSIQIDNRIIRRSLNDLTDKLNTADRKLNRWNEKDKRDFNNHFGTKDNIAKGIIKERVENEKDLILNTENIIRTNKRLKEPIIILIRVLLLM